MEKKPSLLQKLASAQYIVWSVIFIIAPLSLVEMCIRDRLQTLFEAILPYTQ